MPTVAFSEFDGGIDLTRPANMQGANRFRILDNAYITKGKTLKKRPGARYVWSWGSGVKGLFAVDNALRGFYGDGNTGVNASAVAGFVQASGIFQPLKLQRGSGGTNQDNQVNDVNAAFRFAGGIYVAARMASGDRHFFLNGSTGNNAITDANCPHGSHALPLQSKIFATSSTGVVRFSATASATDWTLANDAGFLPTNNQAQGSGAPVALGEFLKKLVVFYPSAAQLWVVGANPANHAFDQRLVIGTQNIDSHANVGSDLFFASPDGVRSIVLHSQYGNALDIDVGSPVDQVVRELLNQPVRITGRYFPSLGQYWLINGQQAYVYSFSRTAKIYAWSRYAFPWSISGADELGGKVYLRSAEGDIYELRDDYPVDDSAELAVGRLGVARNPGQWIQAMPTAGQTGIRVTLRSPFLDMRQPAGTKIIEALDMAASRGPMLAGTPYLIDEYTLNMLYRPDQNGEGFQTGPIDMRQAPDDTRAGGYIPLGLTCPTMAFELTHEAAQSFELSAVAFHFESVGWQ
jgi:hypothetical protein